MQQQQHVQKENTKISEDILIIGGGPAGSFLAYNLATFFDYSVRVIESHPDLRNPNILYHDRSNALSLGVRGISTLKEFGLEEELLKISTIMIQLNVHVDNKEVVRPYSLVHNNFKYSVARRDLTTMLVEQAEKTKKVVYEFSTKVLNLDLQLNTITTVNKQSQETSSRQFNFIIGADGYRSIVRKGIYQMLNQSVQNGQQYDAEIIPCEYSLKSMLVPNFKEYQEMKNNLDKYPLYKTGLDDFYKQEPQIFESKYILNPNDNHIWPQINQFVFLFPNKDGQFNINLCLPNHSQSLISMENQQQREEEEELKQNQNKLSSKVLKKINLNENSNFDSLQTPEQVHQYLSTYVPSLYGLIPNLVDQFINNPPFKTQTILCQNWFYEDKAILFGDACHGMTPYSGSGCNIAFQNVGRFINTLRQYNKNSCSNENQKVLLNKEHRKNVYQIYQDSYLLDTQYAQQLQNDELIFPGLSQARDQESQKHGLICNMLEKSLPDIFMKKINMAFYSNIPHQQVKIKGDLFNKYVYNLMQENKSVEQIDVSNSKQEIEELLKLNNLKITLDL